MFQKNDIVIVADYNKSRQGMDFRLGYRVRVVEPRYMAGDPSSEFVGEALDGRFAGCTMAIQNRHARLSA